MSASASLNHHLALCPQQGGIDSTEYETVSILKLIERRFNLAPLSARDADPKINDLTHTLSEQDCTREHE